MNRANPAAQNGFTLIEILLATTLLAAGMALAFTIVRSTLAISSRGDAIASDNERMRGVHSFLRQRLVSAMPLPMETPSTQGDSTVFHGDQLRMRFVADLPSYLGRGGPHVHTLEVDGRGDAKQLWIGFTLLQAGQPVEEATARDMELLAGGLRQVRLSYRGLDPITRQLGDWQPQWQAPGRMPWLVSIEVIPAHGPAWPPLLVALPRQEAAGSWQ